LSDIKLCKTKKLKYQTLTFSERFTVHEEKLFISGWKKIWTFKPAE